VLRTGNSPSIGLRADKSVKARRSHACVRTRPPHDHAIGTARDLAETRDFC
jgi:hypothetical protein